MSTIGDESPAGVGSDSPARATSILGTLILVAAVANLAVTNVALPDIGDAFDASS